MSYVIFKHIKGTNCILADSISSPRFIHLYDFLDPEEEGKEFEQDIYEELPPKTQTPSTQEGINHERKEFGKFEKSSPTHIEEIPAQI